MWRGLREDLVCSDREQVLENVRDVEGRFPEVEGIELALAIDRSGKSWQTMNSNLEAALVNERGHGHFQVLDEGHHVDDRLGRKTRNSSRSDVVELERGGGLG